MAKRRTPSTQRPVFSPPLERWPDCGVYQLRLRVSGAVNITVGRLGRICFPSGTYVYTGRASRGLRARVLRHVRGARHKHWHIDYLLAYRRVWLERVVLAAADPEAECAVHQAGAPEGVCVAPGFGASDCCRGCPAHLWLCVRARKQRSRRRA